MNKGSTRQINGVQNKTNPTRQIQQDKTNNCFCGYKFIET